MQQATASWQELPDQGSQTRRKHGNCVSNHVLFNLALPMALQPEGQLPAEFLPWVVIRNSDF